MRLSVFVWVTAFFALGCREDDVDEPPLVEAPGDCTAGEWLREDGACIPAGLPPDMRCPPGEWLRDDGTCIAAGVPPDGCGEGFTHDGNRGCDASLPAEPCAPGLMAIPGDVVCREVARCAAGQWGDIPVEPDTEYVDASYPGMDSDGSELKPWTSIQIAVDAAAPGAIVAIAEGIYNEDITVSDKSVRLWGVCPTLVEIVGATNLGAVLIVQGADQTEVRSLAVRGYGNGVASSGAQDVLLDRVWLHDIGDRGVDLENAYGPTSMAIRASLVEQCRGRGVFVAGSDATVEASVVRDTEPGAPGLPGRGVVVQEDAMGAPATLVLSGSLVERSHEHGLFVAGSNVTVEASVVRGTQPGAEGLNGRGVNMQAGAQGTPATLVLRTSVVERNHESGVSLAGSDATIEASVVRDTQPDAQGYATGVVAAASSTSSAPSRLSLRTSLVERSHEDGIYIAGGEVTVEASVVRDTRPDTLGLWGRGVEVSPHSTTGAPATFVLRTSVIEQSHEFGMTVSGSQATLEASVVRDTKPNDEGDWGLGVAAQLDPDTGVPASVILRNSVVEQSQLVAVYLYGADATVETSVVRDTQLDAQGHGGHGVHIEPTVQRGSALSLFGSLVERNHAFGVFALDSTATVASCRIRDTSANAAGLFGDGILVLSDADPASATITATHVERSARAAVAAQGAHVAIGDSALCCQAFDLDHESYQGRPGTLENLGGNFCGCPEATGTCNAVSANLAAPPPLTPP